MKKTSLLVVLSLLVFFSHSESFAKSKKTVRTKTPSTSEIRSKIRTALAKKRSLKPFYNKLQKRYGAKALKPLLRIAHNEKEPIETRWASLFGIAKLAGKESAKTLAKFMRHQNWMLRDAALKAAAAINAKKLRPNIEARLKDKALVVRTTAVHTLGHLKLKKSSPKLVAALFDPVNYHKGKPLWIHKHILNVITEFRYAKAVPKLVKLLEKKRDKKLRVQVIQSLESLTGKSFKNKPINEQVYLWKRNTISSVTF